MKIGIIGAGHIGSTLARKLRQLNHEVKIANSHGPESLAQFSAETGAEAVDVLDAVKNVELVVITIPEKNIEQLPKDLFRGVPESVVVVDTGNYYPDTRDGRMMDLEKAPSESSWVAQTIGRPVIKAFNSMFAYSLASAGLPRGTSGRLALPISGDDRKAKTIVMDLVDALGFDPVDAGSLDESWRQQPGTPVYCTNLDKEAVLKALSETNRERSQKNGKLVEKKLKELSPDSTTDAMVEITRSLQKAA
jgi:predicted dinucleotide-binding enzyme